MKRSKLRSLVKEVLDEISTTGTGATFTPGTGAQYATPYAFSKNKKDNRATKLSKKIGYKKAERPKRPSHTKLFDYLQ
jgi:predicted ribonuclease toxin of YeeF-YezG toxin-antitoxin module